MNYICNYRPFIEYVTVIGKKNKVRKPRLTQHRVLRFIYIEHVENKCNFRRIPILSSLLLKFEILKICKILRRT